MNIFGIILFIWLLDLLLYISHFLVYNFSPCLCRSVDCFRLGWPMRTDADFFSNPGTLPSKDRNGVRNILPLYIHCIVSQIFMLKCHILDITMLA